MFSDIKKLIIDKCKININKNGVEWALYCNVNELFDTDHADCLAVNESEGNDIHIQCDILFNSQSSFLEVRRFSGEEVFKFFFPYEMRRFVQKDFRKERAFDLDYRKHLVHDFSKNHYNIVIPYHLENEIKNKAIKILRSYSTGIQNKPTGIVLQDRVVIVQKENYYIEMFGGEKW